MDETKLAEGVTRGLIGALIEHLKFWKTKKEPSEEDLKKKINVLFIDDEKFEYIDRIRTAGWNVSQIEDLDNLDDERVKRADIIFLDYKGVGGKLSPTDEGIGLLKALKNKYPNKPVIFYSAHAGFSLSDEFNAADDWLAKNADPIVYIQKIEEFARKKIEA